MRMVRNVTDVDDSILPEGARARRARTSSSPTAELARFHSDMDALEMRPPIAEPRATEAIDGMIEMIDAAARLRATRTSRTAPCTSTCRRSRASASCRTTRASTWSSSPARAAATPTTRTGATRSTSCSGSRRCADEPAWRAPFGVGRPGWHIECSVMSMHEPRPDARPARWRHRPDLPAPRVRDRAERERHRQAVRAPLDALGDGQLRGREDEQVARQPRVRERPARRWPTRARSGSR